MKVGESRTENHWHSSRNAWLLRYKIHAVWTTNWPFYLNCVRTGISVITSYNQRWLTIE